MLQIQIYKTSMTPYVNMLMTYCNLFWSSYFGKYTSSSFCVRAKYCHYITCSHCDDKFVSLELLCVTAQANDLEATLVHRNPRETLRASAKPRNIQNILVTVAVIEGKVKV
jgi:hypothetical protein